MTNDSWQGTSLRIYPMNKSKIQNRMTNIKTAISLPESLFKEAEVVANQMKVSRSKLMSMALEEFIQRYQNQNLLIEINAAYADFPNESEKAVQDGMRSKYRQVVENEW